MASRILPIAVATVGGVAIGVATFGPEFKELRKKRLEEEYQRDLAAAAAANGGNMPVSHEQPARSAEVSSDEPKPHEKPSKLSSAFGLWAWQKGGRPEPSFKESHAKPVIDETKR